MNTEINKLCEIKEEYFRILLEMSWMKYGIIGHRESDKV